MKKILTLVIALVFALPMFGQMPQMQPLPTDPSIKIGTLPNGMTYYIRHNDKPAKRCEFWLATNVGALQEEDDQDGLAHFLEHMCFNGTKNFPGKGILNYLQSIGAEFGGNINASTGFEQTQYMLNNIPIEKAGVVDSCLMIMHDYSHFVTCDPKEIDNERGVIVEERRTRRNADWRMYMAQRELIFAGTPYAKRTLIGTEEQLKTFKPESLTTFYHTWYRPDMQALIVVGDIDVNEVEAKIKDIFSDIPEATEKKQKPVVKTPDNEKPIIGIITDKEASGSGIEIMFKSEPQPLEVNTTIYGVMNDIVENLAYFVMQERFNDIKAQADAPILSGYLYIDRLTNYTDIIDASVSFKDGEYEKAFRTLAYELQKLKRYGFTAGELARAKNELISHLEKAASAAETRKHSEFIRPIMNHFYFKDALLDPDTELQYAQMLCEQITPEMLNPMLAQVITDNNMVVIYNAPEREGLTQPTEEFFLNILEEAKTAEIAPNVDEVSNEPLVDPATLTDGKIVDTKAGQFGETIWTLENGSKVVYLKTDYKKDQVLITYQKEGGKSLIATEDLPSFDSNVWHFFVSGKGVADFSKTQLDKMLSGKQVSCTPFVTNLKHGVSAQTTPKDIETAFQLLYLNIAKQRFDETEFNTGLGRLKAMLPNLINNPQFVFQGLILDKLYGGNPRQAMVSMEKVEKANLETIKKEYTRLFDGANGATLYVVGNVEADTLKPLVEKYVGSLAKGGEPTKWVDTKEYMVSGKVANLEKIAMETAKSSVCIVYHVDTPYSVEDEVAYDAAKYILDMVYTETLREDEGGTYGAGVMAMINDKPKEEACLQVFFDTNVESARKLADLANKGINELATKGISDDYFTKTVENLKKNIPENRISNNYWKNVLTTWQEDNIDYDKAYEAAVNNLTKEQIMKAAEKLVKSGNYFELITAPKE